MAEMTSIKILANYFNTGDGKRPLKDFGQELKALTEEEKNDLALGVCAITGDTLKA